jgi:hypothetical protein
MYLAANCYSPNLMKRIVEIERSLFNRLRGWGPHATIDPILPLLKGDSFPNEHGDSYEGNRNQVRCSPRNLIFTFAMHTEL